MHELGIVIEVVNTVRRVAEANQVTKIDAVVLQIGELSSCIPQYVRAVYPAAVDGTMMEDTRLEIEVIPANGRCEDCGKVSHLTETKGACAHCGGRRMELLSGKEFTIKEIVCY